MDEPNGTGTERVSSTLQDQKQEAEAELLC